MKPLYVVTVGGLLAILYLEWRVVPATPPRSEVVAADPPVQEATAPSLPIFTFRLASRERYDIISQRPLFSESRRPEDLESSKPPPVEAQELDGLVLNAVLLRGAQRIALINDPKSKETKHLAQGEQVRGWTVSAIHPDGIDLSFGDRTSRLELRIFSPPVVAAKGPKKARDASRIPRRPRAKRRRRPARPVSRRPSRYE